MTSARRARLRAASAALLVAGLATASVVAAPLAASAVPMTFDVTSTADSGAGSLREAIGFANLNLGADTITFHLPANSQILPLSNIIIEEALTVDGVDTPGLTIAGGAPLTYQVFLVAPTVAGGSYTFRNLTFDGSVGHAAFLGGMIYVTVGLASAQTVTVDKVVSRNLLSAEGSLLNIFTMAPGGNATVVDSTFATNRANQGGSLAFRGINGTIAITRSTFTDNRSVTGDGGAIYVDGTGGGTPTVTVSSSTFTDSLAQGLGGRGGAIFANFVAGFSVADSAFSGGSAIDGGGAIAIFGMAPGNTSTVSIARSSFTGNQSATSGGAIRFGPSTGVVSPGGITIDSSTFAANFLTSGSGHSIAFTSFDAFGAAGSIDAPFSVINSTFDEAGAAGAVPYAMYLDTIDGTASVSVANSTVIGGIGVGLLDSTAVTIDHSILWGGAVPQNDFAAAGFTGVSSVAINWSLISGPSEAFFAAGTGNQFAVPAHGLDPLANNGGPTQTRLPSAGSPALNAGNPAFGAVPAFDQRGAGFIRRVGVIDIGAAEVQAAAGPQLSATGGTVSPGLPLGAAFLILTGLALLLFDYRRRYPVTSGA